MLKNLFGGIPDPISTEDIDTVLSKPGVRIERIVSHGHASPPGFWYDQEENEWVVVLAGSARLLFEGQAISIELKAGDHIEIAAHRRHRVEWTDPNQDTIWLAVFWQ